MPKKRSTESESKSNRRVGKPKRDEKAVTPLVVERIASLWLQGTSERKIGEALGISRADVRFHLNQSVWPEWRDSMRSSLEVDLAKVGLLESMAWEQFLSTDPCEIREKTEKAVRKGKTKPRVVKQTVRTVTRTGDIRWLHVVKWCIDFRSRVFNYYKQLPCVPGSEERLAGIKREIDIDWLFENIRERKRYEQSLKPDSN